MWIWSGKKFATVLALLCTGVIIQSKFPEIAVWFSFIMAATLAFTKEY